MAKTPKAEPTLEELLARSSAPVTVPLREDEIGGELVALLSKGLYANPLDCIREYIQNAVDAGAKNITVKITANSIWISDDGRGMGLEQLLQARQFGISTKSASEHVGFRGIGIYSGFDMSQRLEITTRVANAPTQHVLTFDFAEMKRVLDKERTARATGGPRTSVITLLSAHTSVSREPAPAHKNGYTRVTLAEISDAHIKQLSNREALRNYLLQNVPLDFADDFEHKKVINDQLELHVPNFKAVKVTLDTDGQPPETIVKEGLKGLQAPKYDVIKVRDKKVAFFWSCLNGKRERIHQDRDANGRRADGGPSYEGFAYKVKGFTVGTRDALRSKFTRAQVYPWYTGEVYVLDDQVVPNAARDDFETSPEKLALDLAVGAKLRDLEEDATTFQSQGKADEKIEELQGTIEKLRKQVDSNTVTDQYETWSTLAEIVKVLKKQRGKATTAKKSVATTLIKTAEGLQQRVRKDVEQKTDESKQKKRAAKSKADQPTTNVPAPSPTAEPPLRTIRQLLEDSGWELAPETTQLADLVYASLQDSLGPSSASFKQAMNDIAERLSADSDDD